MKNILINNKEYLLEKNYKDAFDLSVVKEMCTDYFDNYDYIFGDYSYDKLRLKGFYNSNNKSVRKINDIKGLDSYIKDYCSYECRYFLLKKVK